MNSQTKSAFLSPSKASNTTYIIRPLRGLEDFQAYAAMRRHYDKRLSPNSTRQYKGQYEVDTYDLYSKHIGMYGGEEEKLIGFVRITPPTQMRNEWETEVPEGIKEFVKEVQGISQFQECKEHLPLLQTCTNPKTLRQYLEDKRQAGELGRLIVHREKPFYKIPINLISYACAVGLHKGLSHYCIRTQARHVHFYHHYFQADYLGEEQEADNFVPACYALEELHPRAMKVVWDIKDRFDHVGQLTPMVFEKYSLIDL